jgi:hypothetical protein
MFQNTLDVLERIKYCVRKLSISSFFWLAPLIYLGKPASVYNTLSIPELLSAK